VDDGALSRGFSGLRAAALSGGGFFSPQRHRGAEESVRSFSVFPVLSVVKLLTSKAEGFTTEDTESTEREASRCASGVNRDPSRRSVPSRIVVEIVTTRM
jgi:hypothetical protein